MSVTSGWNAGGCSCEGDPFSEGIEQIAEALKGRSKINAIHVVGHGSEGSLDVSSGVLNAETMRGEYLDERSAIGQVLAADGDILIYGCDFTAGDAVLEGTIVLRGITGADVASSMDETGSAVVGGDCELECATCAIETSVAAVDYDNVVNYAALAGACGSLTPSADGTFSHTVDSANAMVPALLGGAAPVEAYRYTMPDADGDTSTAPPSPGLARLLASTPFYLPRLRSKRLWSMQQRR